MTAMSAMTRDVGDPHGGNVVDPGDLPF